MKKIIQRLLGAFGYQVRRTYPIRDAFTAQQALIRKPSPVIIDGGAHVGHVTAKYRTLFPKASIYAFEPNPEAFAQLNNRVTGDPRTQAHPLALADKEDTVVLHTNVYPETNSLLPSYPKGSPHWADGNLDTTDQIKVKATSLDAFCQAHEIPAIDILKLDVQGAEYLALQGAKEMLGQQTIALIYLEIILAPLYQGQPRLLDYLKLFDTFGYTLLDWYNPARTATKLIQAVYIFINKALAEQSDRLLN